MKGFTVWLTGKPNSGKTTTARLLESKFRQHGTKVEVLDGDLIRGALSRGLGYSKHDRDENVRRIGFVCELLSRNGIAVIVAAVSPYQEARNDVRSRIPHFIEVYMDCPFKTLVERDEKGLYKRALAGELLNFTGVTDPYEPPPTPEVTIHSSEETAEQGVEKIWAALAERGLVLK